MSESELTKLWRLIGLHGDMEQRSDGISIPYDCNDSATFIPAPTRPVEPVYESEDLPDKGHDYEVDSWGDMECRLCGCTNVLGFPERQAGGCARISAVRRNERKRQAYERRVAAYKYQMEYYNSVIVPLGKQPTHPEAPEPS